MSYELYILKDRLPVAYHERSEKGTRIIVPEAAGWRGSMLEVRATNKHRTKTGFHVRYSHLNGTITTIFVLSEQNGILVAKRLRSADRLIIVEQYVDQSPIARIHIELNL
jgi:hypothetical protein